MRFDVFLVTAHGQKVDTFNVDFGGLVLLCIGRSVKACTDILDGLDDSTASRIFDERKDQKLGCADFVLQTDEARITFLVVKLEGTDFGVFAQDLLSTLIRIGSI